VARGYRRRCSSCYRNKTGRTEGLRRASAGTPGISSDLVCPFCPLSCGLASPDPLHAYLGLCGLSLIGEPDLRKVHPALNITQRAFQHLQQLQQTWRDNTGSCIGHL
ncbi:hypothetical protein GOODEAATRI_004554, partial [Goodea atripinnis]